ncbi:unnamed protein product [Paramecium sonneborni]|uniref:Uncharacterized protein n=1 Tax=Paramecium sonneborni TaxID=65129 RepID=A0A8S1L5T2_9CILI|nr:unnamed protein product [Paramecium sonneborni]
MGTSICVKGFQSNQSEVKINSKCSHKLNGPPNMFKPTPIISILITDQQVEKEESPKKELNEQQNQNKCEQLFQYTLTIKSMDKKNFVIETINVSKFKNDEMHNSNNFNQNNLCEQKNSLNETSKQKHILKNKSGQDSSNISISADSQKSIKKVSIDKKQQVYFTKCKN